MNMPRTFALRTHPVSQLSVAKSGRVNAIVGVDFCHHSPRGGGGGTFCGRSYRPRRKLTSETVAIFQSEYLDKGSPGLKDFLRLRIRSAENLVTTIDRMPKYYASIRPQTLQVQRMEKRMRDAFKKFKSIYPNAVFPDVYFLIGVTSSADQRAEGLVIGTEMYGKNAKTRWTNECMVARCSRMWRSARSLAHESCTTTRTTAGLRTRRHLLGSRTTRACDTIGELISGRTINAHLNVYGKTHDAELARLQADM